MTSLAIEAVFQRLGTDFQGTLQERMGIEYLEVTAQRVVGRMPVKGNNRSYGLLHGGASCVFAETLGTVAATLHAGEGRVGVGIEINASHHRSTRSGHVRGVATAIHLGRRFATYDVVITDESERRICTARVNCILLSKEETASAPNVVLDETQPAS